MMAEPIHAANTPPATATEIKSLAIVVPPNAAPDAMAEALWGNVNFNLTASAMQRHIDRMKFGKSERSKTLGAAVKAAIKELKAHASGDAWQRFLEAQTRLRAARKAGTPYDLDDVEIVAAYGSASARLFIAAEDAAKTKKDEMERIGAKIAKHEGVLATHLRKGPGGHDVEDACAQETLPGFDAAPAATGWDKDTSQVTLNVLTSEIRTIDRDLAAANVANDAAKIRKAEAAREQYADLLGVLTAAGLLGDLAPEEEDMFEVVPVVEDADDVGLDDELDDEPGAPPEFKLEAEANAPEHEDPTKHPALQPAIKDAANKRTAKKTSSKKAGGSKRGRKPKAE